MPTAPFPNFYGSREAAQTLAGMLEHERISQTILLSGPEGVGKATLARRFGAALLGDGAKIEADDLSRPENVETIEAREKWPADKRGDDSLLFSSHPDFTTFAPDGPMRQISIQQVRTLRERAQFQPLRGRYRIFLIKHLERANEQAANSLLKILEEPPPHLVIMATVDNLYDLLPTIRSRALILHLHRLADGEMEAFVRSRGLSDASLRATLANGSPGVAVRLDPERFRARREVWMAAFESGARLQPWAHWVRQSEPVANSQSEKLDKHWTVAYGLLRDLLAVREGRTPVVHRDIAKRLQTLAGAIDFSWIEKASKLLDEMVLMNRRNIQKIAALDALVVNLRN